MVLKQFVEGLPTDLTAVVTLRTTWQLAQRSRDTAGSPQNASLSQHWPGEGAGAFAPLLQAWDSGAPDAAAEPWLATQALEVGSRGTCGGTAR